MKIYAIEKQSMWTPYFEKFFADKAKAREYLRNDYKKQKQDLRNEIISKDDLNDTITERYTFRNDYYVIRYWGKVSLWYEYDEWDIISLQKRIVEVEVEEWMREKINF